MTKPLAFQDVQLEFTRHLRDPDNQAAPQGIEDRRLGIYRELFFNNISGFIDSAFPVLKTLYTQEQWRQLIRHFFVVHQCESPLFLEISKEFLDFLQQECPASHLHFPFTLELAHYEWIELSVSARMEQNKWPLIVTEDALVNLTLVFSELAEVLSYQYPVQHISDEFMPDEPATQQQFLVVYRTPKHDVKFLEINAISALLLEQLKINSGVSFSQLITSLAEQLPQFSYEQLHQGALSTMLDLGTKGIVRKFIDFDQ